MSFVNSGDMAGLYERATGHQRWQLAQGLRCVSVCSACFIYQIKLEQVGRDWLVVDGWTWDVGRLVTWHLLLF